jgi:SAM-dependent methyltransferase
MRLFSKCPVCQSNSISPFLKREKVPVHQNLVIKDQRSALEIRRSDLNLFICGECSFVFNESFEPSELRYGEQYDNSQSFSRAFEYFLSHIARYLITKKNVKNCMVVEVGCGKGTFLRKLVEMGRNIGWGFDPSYVGPTADLNGSLKFEKSFYSPEFANIHADVIVCRHVIEHVPNPIKFLCTIRKSLSKTSSPKLFIETPSLEWIINKKAIWDFFYEHCSYFTSGSLTTALEIAGFKVEKITRVFGNQYLWVEAIPFPKGRRCRITTRRGSIPHLAHKIAALESKITEMWERKIREYAKKGRVAIWGAGAKGVTFANLVDPECRWISCVIDLNPNKQGKYLPGTGHPITSYREMKNYGVNRAIMMNSNYMKENLRYLKEAKMQVHLVDLMKLGVLFNENNH